MAIQIKRGLASQWAASSYVLLPGQPGIETDTGALAVGDGTTLWAALQKYQTKTALDKLYAPSSATPTYGQLAWYNGDPITAGMNVAEDGIKGPTIPTPVGEVVLAFGTPGDTTYTSTTWGLYRGTGTSRVQVGADQTVPGMTARVRFPGLSWTWDPAEKLYPVCKSQAGGDSNSYLGQGVYVYIAYGTGSTIPAAAAPAVPSLTLTNGADRVTYSASLPAGTQVGLLVRDGKPYRWIIPELPSGYDLLATGESHTYQLSARGVSAFSALTTAQTGTTTGGGGTSSNTYTGYAAGATTPANFGPLITGTGGTTPTTLPAYTMGDVNGVRALTATTGSTGGGNKNDDLGQEFNADTAGHVPWDVSYSYGYDQSTGQFDLAATAQHETSTFPLTTGLLLRVQPDGLTLIIKSTTAGSCTFGGTTYTITANSSLLLPKQTNSATVTVDTTGASPVYRDYGVRFLTLANSDGTITARFYQGTVAQLTAGTLPQIGGDVIINAAAAAGIPAGYHWWHVYGKSGAGQTGTQYVRLARYTVKAG